MHKSVLSKEVIDFLEVKPNRRFIDATVGGGGHVEAVLEKGGVVLGLDQDPTALGIARKRLLTRFREFETGEACFDRYQSVRVLHPVVHSKSVFKLVHSNFADIFEIASKECFDKVNGVLFDLGFASFQLENSDRGLTFSKDGPLDMRLDPRLGVTAADLVNTLPEKQLYGLFKTVGEEKRSRAIAHAIVKGRAVEPIKTTIQLKGLIEEVYGQRGSGKIHPATKVFMALRIAVNTEFENLIQGLKQAFKLLASGGRLVVISFHSGEDRIVKNYFKSLSEQGLAKILTKKPIEPSLEEIMFNPRSRSAKLRAIEVI